MRDRIEEIWVMAYEAALKGQHSQDLNKALEYADQAVDAFKMSTCIVPLPGRKTGANASS